METFNNVIQPDIKDVFHNDHPLKGRWNKEIFRNDNPIILELGCGKGEYTVGLAGRFPEYNYIGVDIKGARIWRGAKTAKENKILNAVFLRTKIELINSFFAENEVDEIWITFPDPYPNNRNANKRLISPFFLNCYRLFLKNKGIIHLKTDNGELLNYTLGIVNRNNLELILFTEDIYSMERTDNVIPIMTHYENLFLEQNFKIKYLSFRLNKTIIVRDVHTQTK